MVIRNRNPHRNRPTRSVMARNGRNYQSSSTNSTSHTTSWLWVFFVWAFMSALDIFLTFRIEYFYPVFLAIQETHYLWKTSTLSSLFFLVVNISADITIFSLWKSDNLFIFAGFLVWLNVIFSGLEIKSPTLYTAIGSIFIVLLDFLLYSTKSNPENEGYYFAEGLKPVAAHCIGYPLVSIGYCLKRYMAYLLRLRKQNEVEAKNKYYYNMLYEALPPAAYNQSAERIWERDFLELEPERDDEDSSTSSKSEKDAKAEKETPTWSQRLKELFQDLTCFSGSSRSHLLTVKEPARSQPGSSKSSGGSTRDSNVRAYRVYRWLESIACWLRECFASSTSSTSGASSNAPPVHNSVDAANSSGATNSHSSAAPNAHVTSSSMNNQSSSAGKSPPSSNCHSGGSNQNRRVNATKAKNENQTKSSSASHSPALEKSLPKNSASENCQKTENNSTKHSKKNHQEKDDNGDGQYSRHTPTKKEKNNLKSQNHGEHLYTQIQKQDSIKTDDSQSNQNSRGDSDATQAELGRIKRENEKLKKNESQLKGKIDDLTQHEEFTKKQFEDVKKRDESLRNQLKVERERTGELRSQLKEKNDESRLLQSNLNDREAENERLRHQLKKSEMERELLNQEAKNREQELQHSRSKIAEGELKINQLHRIVEERQQSVRNSQEKLQAESRLKLQLLERLNTQQQEIEDLRHRSTLYQRPVIHDF